MLFSEDSKTLRTDKGNLDLETGEWTTDNLRACRNPQRPPSVSISDDRSWILYDNEELMWLPEAYRPWYATHYYFGKHTIAYITRGEKSALTMEFADPHSKW